MTRSPPESLSLLVASSVSLSRQHADPLLYSVLTRYELGLMPTIPMPVHLWLDGLGGALPAASPWLLGFAEHVWAPHLILGLVEIGAALTTQTRPWAAPLRGPFGHAR